MNKKFLSAILFGALMVTSTGTFVSCKDYDDDIEDLQTQIEANVKSIADLKATLDGANYVTDVTISGNNLVVTTKTGGSKTIALPEDQKGSMVTVNAEGYLEIDGKATDIKGCDCKVTEEGEFLPAVKIEGGEWMVLQEDDTYAPLGLKASSIAVTGNESEGYVLTVTDGEGNETVVKLPTAASSIVNIAFDNNVQQNGDTLNIAKATWAKSPSNYNWKGTKTLPADGDAIYTSADQIDVRIDPVSVDATTVPFYLTTSKNSTMKYITLSANEDKSELAGAVTGRAAYGNGLYKLTYGPQLVAKKDVKAFDKDITDHNNKLHALNANSTFRSTYTLQVKGNATVPTLDSLKVNGGDSIWVAATEANTVKVVVGKANEVKFMNPAALYDMYFTVEDKYKEAFSVTWDDAAHKFTVGKNPDSATIGTEFPLNIHTADISGNIKVTTITVSLNPEITSIKLYGDATHDVSSYYNNFAIQLADMHTALGSNLNTWKLNVKSHSFGLYSEYKDGDVKGASIANSPLQEAFMNGNDVAAEDKASSILVIVDNAKGLKLDTKYYIKVSFYNDATTQDESTYLNAIIVPITFTAPTVAEQIEVKAGYVKEGAINAYFYDTDSTVNKYVKLDKYFTFATQIKNANVNFVENDNLVKYEGDNKMKSTSQLIKLGDAAKKSLSTASLMLNDQLANWPYATELGYGQKLNLSISQNNYDGWTYTVKEDSVYAFSMRIMSPIYEGSIKPAEGNTIKISANDLVNGAKITDAMIMGYDYNNNSFDIVPDRFSNQTAPCHWWWEDPQIALVEPTVDTKGYLKSVELTKATKDADGKTVKGSIVVKGESLSQTTEVLMPVYVTDCWGYVLAQEVSVTIEVK